LIDGEKVLVMIVFIYLDLTLVNVKKFIYFVLTLLTNFLSEKHLKTRGTNQDLMPN